MLKRLFVTFEQLGRFSEPVSVDLSKRLCTFVGPNGSGKSTILAAVAEVLAFLKRYLIEGDGDEVRNAIKPKRSAAQRSAFSSGEPQNRVCFNHGGKRENL